MSKILLTCFEAFNNKSTNTTTLVVEKINQDNIYKLTLPVSYTRSVEVLKNVVRDYKPDLIISLGEANRTKNVEIEKFAHNIQHASIPDNDGVIKINEKINDSSLCLTPNYDVYQMVSKLQKDGYNVIMSQSAGSYICNLVMYTILEMKELKLIKDAAFIHIPHLEGEDLSLLDSITKCIDQFIIYIRKEYNIENKELEFVSVKKKINPFQRKKIEKIYNLKIKEAESLIKLPDKVYSSINETKEALEEIPYIGFELKFINQFISALEYYISNRYIDFTNKTINYLFGAILYFIAPYDIISDKMLVVGYYDEIYVIEKCLEEVSLELDKFIIWKEKQIN